MKRLFFIIACLFTLPVYAQDTSVDVHKLPTFIDCGSNESIAKVMESYQTEIPFAQYEKMLLIPPGQMLRGLAILFIDPESGSWTEIFQLPLSNPNPLGIEKCITGFGTGFKPYVGKERT